MGDSREIGASTACLGNRALPSQSASDDRIRRKRTQRRVDDSAYSGGSVGSFEGALDRGGYPLFARGPHKMDRIGAAAVIRIGATARQCYLVTAGPISWWRLRGLHRPDDRAVP